MDFKDLTDRAVHIRKLYSEFEKMRYGNPWSNVELALGFVGDVGDLAKLVMARSGLRDMADVERQLAHELADCLWSVMVLAHVHGVDLEAEFLRTMDDLEQKINIQKDRRNTGEQG
jgi:NTP pyrophosphatase (non-canonical NTP hydrolase)